jgi:hypothetical protein
MTTYRVPVKFAIKKPNELAQIHSVDVILRTTSFSDEFLISGMPFKDWIQEYIDNVYFISPNDNFYQTFKIMEESGTFKFIEMYDMSIESVESLLRSICESNQNDDVKIIDFFLFHNL